MTEAEQQVFAQLGSQTEVWRGTKYRRSIGGLSWTTDRVKALWFGRRSRRSSPILLASGTVLRRDVLAVFCGREEQELVCDKVGQVRIEEIPD